MIGRVAEDFQRDVRVDDVAVVARDFGKVLTANDPDYQFTTDPTSKSIHKKRSVSRTWRNETVFRKKYMKK